MSLTEQQRAIGVTLSAALDAVKNSLEHPDGWRLAFYLGREEDPLNAYLVGNVAPEQLHAAIGALILDAGSFGVIDRVGNFTPTPKAQP